MKKALVLFCVFAFVANMGLFADDIKWKLMNRSDLINITSVSTAVVNQIKIEYTAKKAIPVMTLYIKCFYSDGTSPKTYDNEERSVKNGGSRSPTVFAHSPSKISRVEISIKEFSKKDVELLEKTEGYLNTMSQLMQAVPSDKVKEFAGHLDRISGVLGVVNKGMDVYKTIKDLSEVIAWGNLYKDAKTDEEKIRAGNRGNKKILEMIPKLAAFAGGPLYGMIIPVVCKMVSNTYNTIARRAQNIDLTWWYQDDAFYDVYYGNEDRFGNLVLDMKSNGASIKQVTTVLKELIAIEQMTGQKLFQ